MVSSDTKRKQKLGKAAKTRSVALRLIPLPSDSFGPEEATKWLEQDFRHYVTILEDGFERLGDLEESSNWFPYCEILGDVRAMVRACFLVIKGQ